MARNKIEKKVKEIKNKTSNNLKSGKFDRKELSLYGLKDEEIELILNYQLLLPILQEENDKWIDNMKEQLELQDEIDIKTTLVFKGYRSNVKTTYYN